MQKTSRPKPDNFASSNMTHTCWDSYAQMQTKLYLLLDSVYRLEYGCDYDVYLTRKLL